MTMRLTMLCGGVVVLRAGGAGEMCEGVDHMCRRAARCPAQWAWVSPGLLWTGRDVRKRGWVCMRGV